VILIFGTAKLKNFGGDIGGAIKGFKKAMNDDDDDKPASSKQQAPQIAADEKEDAQFSEQAEKEKHN
jgi:sec-independent protein translocase protein TatA